MFLFPPGCERVRLDVHRHDAECAFQSPVQRRSAFMEDVLESNYPLSHLCVHFEKCPEGTRKACEEGIANLRKIGKTAFDEDRGTRLC